MTLQGGFTIAKNYAGGTGKLTPDREPDLVFLVRGNNLIAMCEVKTPCMIKRSVFKGQLRKFALKCESEGAVFYLCVPAQSFGAALLLIAETKIFEKLIERRLFKLFTFNATPDGFKGMVEEALL